MLPRPFGAVSTIWLPDAFQKTASIKPWKIRFIAWAVRCMPQTSQLQLPQRLTPGGS